MTLAALNTLLLVVLVINSTVNLYFQIRDRLRNL